MRIAAIGLVALAGLPLLPVEAGPAPAEKAGLKVGEVAPPFTLKDQQGKERSLKELLAGGPVALVFYRSARW